MKIKETNKEKNDAHVKDFYWKEGILVLCKIVVKHLDDLHAGTILDTMKVLFVYSKRVNGCQFGLVFRV